MGSTVVEARDDADAAASPARDHCDVTAIQIVVGGEQRGTDPDPFPIHGGNPP
jgi:hypothetical protein